MAAPIFRIARKLRLSRALARDSLRTPTIETRLLNVRGATGARHASNQALAVMPADMNDVKVWFGSQTGTAQGFGMQLQSHLQDASVNAELADLFDLGGDPSQISAEKSVIFIVSCFGRGEPTDSAKKFYHWIMDPARETDTKLTGLRYAVFGLGSAKTHKEYYNVIGKKLDARLEQLGAQRVFERGEGDASGASIELDFEGWETRLLESIAAAKTAGPNGAAAARGAEASAEEAAKAAKPLFAPGRSTNPYHSDTDCTLTIVPADTPCNPCKPAPPPPGTTACQVIEAAVMNPAPVHVPAGFASVQVKSLTNLTPSELRPMYELCMAVDDISNSSAVPGYKTGDHVSIMPVNSQAVVDRLCARLRWDQDFAFSLQQTGSAAASAGASGDSSGKAGGKVPIQGLTTVGAALRHNIAIGGPLTPQMLRVLASCAGDAKDKEKITALADRNNFVSAVRDNYLQLIDVLEAHPSVMMPLDRYLATAGPLLPRFYSISSAGPAAGASAHLDHLDVTFRHLRIPRQRDTSSVFNGTCSTYMSQLVPGDRVAVGVRPSSFRLPTDPSRPIVMIAGGIGIAPFRAFLLDRMAQRAANQDLRFGPSLLLYGCRDRTDQVYTDLFRQAMSKGALQHVDVGYAAPSKATLAFTPRPRLADALVMEHADEIWSCVSKGGSIYVCGGASGFGSAVAASVKDVIRQKNGFDAAGADAYMGVLLKENRFLEDLAD